MLPEELGKMGGCSKNWKQHNPALSCHLTAGRSQVAVPLSLRVFAPVSTHSPRTRTLGSVAALHTLQDVCKVWSPRLS